MTELLDRDVRIGEVVPTEYFVVNFQNFDGKNRNARDADETVEKLLQKSTLYI